MILRFGDMNERFGGEPTHHQQPHGTGGRYRRPGSLKEACEVEIVTDSEYLKNGITSWIDGWKRNGWMTSAKKPVTIKTYG